VVLYSGPRSEASTKQKVTFRVLAATEEVTELTRTSSYREAVATCSAEEKGAGGGGRGGGFLRFPQSASTSFAEPMSSSSGAREVPPVTGHSSVNINDGDWTGQAAPRDNNGQNTRHVYEGEDLESDRHGGHAVPLIPGVPAHVLRTSQSTGCRMHAYTHTRTHTHTHTHTHPHTCVNTHPTPFPPDSFLLFSTAHRYRDVF
jgi:hypothetical protein